MEKLPVEAEHHPRGQLPGTRAGADVSRAVVQVELNRKPDPTLDDGDELDGLDEDEDDEFGDDADQDDDATEPHDAAEEN